MATGTPSLRASSMNFSTPGRSGKSSEAESFSKSFQLLTK
eukprot:UN16288